MGLIQAGCGPGCRGDACVARWWWLCLAAFGRSPSAGFGTATSESIPIRTRRRINAIGEASARLRDVLVEHADFRVVIERYDCPDALLYCDPPYAGHEELYAGEGRGFTEADHRDLAALLNAAKGKVALSYYPCDLVEELYPSPPWRREEKAWLCTLSNPKSAPDANYQRSELLLMNYAPPAQQLLF